VPTPDVPARIIPAGELLQHVSRAAYCGSPLHFGRAAVNRYDDPARIYGTLYVGFDLATSLMESVFHQHRWSRRARRVISRTEVFSRMVRAIGVLEPLSFADLTAPGVMAAQLGLNCPSWPADTTSTRGAYRRPCTSRSSLTEPIDSTVCSTPRATTTPPPAPRCSTAQPRSSRSSRTSRCVTTSTGRRFSRGTRSSFCPFEVCKTCQTLPSRMVHRSAVRSTSLMRAQSLGGDWVLLCHRSGSSHPACRPKFASSSAAAPRTRPCCRPHVLPAAHEQGTSRSSRC
jgi:hypothetical protein